MNISIRWSGSAWLGSVLLLFQSEAFALFGAAGDVDLSFDPGSGVDGQVSAIIMQPDGKVLVGGSFSIVKGLLRTNLARLNAAGSGDPSFDAGLAGNTITAMALQADGKLLVGGTFPQLYCDDSGCTEYFATALVRFNTNGSRDASFISATAEYYSQSGEFSSLTLQPDGRILVGGTFSSVNGTNRTGIARLQANGTLDTSFNTGAGPNGAVQLVALQPDGKVIIGGWFTSFDGTNCRSLARLNANGTLDSSFDSGFGVTHPRECGPQFECHDVSYPTAAKLQPDGKVVVGFWSEYYQCDPFEGGCLVSYTYGVTRLNTSGSTDPGFVFTNVINNVALLGLVKSIAVQPDGNIVVGSSAYNTVHIARLNANGSLDDSFHSAVEPGGVNAVALRSDGRILVGGSFATVNGTNRNHLARLNTNGGLDLGFGSGLGVRRPLSQVSLQSDGKVLIGGPIVAGNLYFGPLGDELAFINGTNRYGRTRLNADGSLDRTFTPTPFLANWSPTYPDDCLGPPFGCSQGAVASLRLVQSDGKVILSGYTETTITGDETFFQTYGNFLARYHADGSLDMAFTPPTNTSIVSAIQQPDGKIVIGGNVTLNGTNFSVARLNLDGSADSNFQLGQVPASVSSLVLQPDGKLVVAEATVVRLNSNGTRDHEFGSVSLSNGVAYSLALQGDGKIIIGGSFNTVNGTTRHRIARLNSNGTLDNTFDPGAGPDGVVRSIALQ